MQQSYEVLFCALLMTDFDKLENTMLYIGAICAGKGAMWKGGMDFLVPIGKTVTDEASIVYCQA